MWKYYAFKIAGLTIAYLPKSIGYFIAHVIAYLVYILSPSLRASIKDNMKHVLGPGTSDNELGQAARSVLKNTARNYFDLIKIPHMKLTDIKNSMIIHGWHNLDDAIRKGKGVILTTEHLGSFDMAVQILAAHSIKTTILVEPLEPPSLFGHVTTLRSSNGISFLPARLGAIEELIHSLRRGEVVLLVCDRDIVKNGLKLNFFDAETTMPSIAVRMAMRTGAAVVPTFNLRRGDGRYEVFFEPVVDIIPAGNGALVKNMERVAHIMEKHIKRCPEQWVVLSPIWGTE